MKLTEMPNLDATEIMLPHRQRTTSTGRLPTNVKPKHYDITIETNVESSAFKGTVVIDLEILESLASISLNTLDLDIQSTDISVGGLVIIPAPHLSYVQDTQTLQISFDKLLHAGTAASLRLNFTGHISSSMAGISVSNYKGADDITHHVLSTAFAPTDARRAFPCFDEPAFRACFTITVIAENHLTCLSNMEVSSQKLVTSGTRNHEKKAVTFQTTPNMSTYNVCFVIGEFDMIQSNDFRVPVRVFTTRDNKIEHCRFALDLAVRTLKLYESTFEILFPLPKMDMLTIPERLGATENWGAIFYAARDIVCDPDSSSLTAKQHVADTVQHELAHQWFGNLVTSEYWDGIWLNEGFATWMAWYSSNILFPEWKIWQNHVLTILQSALSLDSLRSSHPIEVPITKVSDIAFAFDDIAYFKGSSLIRMISMRIGEDVFLEGIRKYLKRHAYGNATTNDLWAALNEASGEDIGKVMSIWSKNTGYPVISVSENESATQIHIEQNRFLNTGDVKEDENKTLFPVFLHILTEERGIKDVTILQRKQSFSTESFKMLKLNSGQFGFYRTAYSPARLKKLTVAANAGSLSIEDIIGIVMDAGALASAGYQRTSEVLSLIYDLKLESNFFLWSAVLSQIEAIKKAIIFEDPQLQNSLEAFTRNLVSSEAHKIGWNMTNNEDEFEKEVKSILFANAGLSGDRRIIQDAFDMFESSIKDDGSPIPPSLRLCVFQIVLKYGGIEEYEAILSLSQKTTDVELRDTAYLSLGQAANPSPIQRTLDLSLSGKVSGQGIKYVLRGLRAHKEGLVALWEWLKRKWDYLLQRFGSGMDLFILRSIVQCCTASLTTLKQFEDIRDFFENQAERSFDKIIQQSADTIRAQAAWVERDRVDIKDWLKKAGFVMDI